MESITNILEISPAFACWFQCSGAEFLTEMPQRRSDALSAGFFLRDKSSTCQCFYLRGAALTFDLKPHTFDFIGRSSEFSALHSLLLDRKCRRWLKPGGAYGLFLRGLHGFEHALAQENRQIAFRPTHFILERRTSVLEIPQLNILALFS